MNQRKFNQILTAKKQKLHTTSTEYN